MLIPLILFVLLLVVAILIVWGLRIYRTYRRIENLHRDLAQRLSLHIAYSTFNDFTIFGRFRGYPVKVIPFTAISAPGFVCFSVSMTNPNLKWLRISKNLSEELRQISFNDKSIVVRHDIGADIVIETNDMLFAGLILSENVKISIHDTFRDLPEGLFYLDGESMNFILTRPLRTEEDLKTVTKIVHLLCDMKDELN
ncbi:MAG: hypothetical protein R3C61_10790 [Bacteroidia bacterium]